MRLKSLRLQGFKSFPDRTSLEFRSGVTAIVGSNGCGKSNIADSVRWVLGEQRASAMRGAKMEEIIFQGTTRRKPLHHAEVALLFDNDRGRVPLPQSEIEVSRKVFREGGSEYALNRNACRLRDIHNLLRETGLGSNTYAVIESSMIETLLSDRAEERRLLFEEAAGIGRYKDSRHAATRRLESAEADLERLQDLIAEVDAKVRSLARQRRRAERYDELQARRMNLEVALTRAERDDLTTRLEADGKLRVELEQVELTAASERRSEEEAAERAREAAATLAASRVAAAGQLDSARSRLETRERELLVANERRTHMELRIQELLRERAEVEAQATALSTDADELASAVTERSAALSIVRQKLEDRATENQTIRGAVAAERAAAEVAAARTRELARMLATTEGERGSTQRRRREADQLAAEVQERERAIRAQLTGLEQQGELFGAMADEGRTRLDAANGLVARIRAEVGAIGEQERELSERHREVQDHCTRLASQIDAREAVERSYEGFAPAVSALMTRFGRAGGVHAPLADFLGSRSQDPARLQRIEAFLGPLLQAVVVQDRNTVRAVRQWFLEEWTGGGSLVLLPLDAPVLADADADSGGEAWAKALLEDVVIDDVDPFDRSGDATARVGRDGEVVDRRGVVRLAARAGGEGILARREALTRLKREREEAEGERRALSEARDALHATLVATEARLASAEGERRQCEEEVKRMDLDSASHSHHLQRLREDLERAVESLAGLRANGVAAGERLEELNAQFARLTAEATAVGVAEHDARGRLEGLEERWEAARDLESELRVAVARAEAAAREAEGRRAAVEQGRGMAASRLQAIDREVAELVRGMEELRGVGGEADGEIERLFGERDRAAAEVTRLDGLLDEVRAAERQAAEAVRVAGKRESEAATERHRVELRIAELQSRAERSLERIEVAWGRSWAALVTAAGEVGEVGEDGWRDELADLTRQVESIGPVNALAVREHAEEQTRLDFLVGQRADLEAARDDLVAAIRQINRTAREVFMETFDAVRINFQRVFQSLFQGGECDVWLADPDDPLESAVEIQASPRGKRTQRIHLLSGGERTLTALALLFALYLVKPSPFCLMDEVDAPLDESNVVRFLQLLDDFKAETQFIVITHNPRTMEAADWVYGVTMEEPGVSTVVGVELTGRWAKEEGVVGKA